MKADQNLVSEQPSKSDFSYLNEFALKRNVGTNQKKIFWLEDCSQGLRSVFTGFEIFWDPFWTFEIFEIFKIVGQRFVYNIFWISEIFEIFWDLFPDLSYLYEIALKRRCRYKSGKVLSTWPFRTYFGKGEHVPEYWVDKWVQVPNRYGYNHT